jgi:hypothetical protein
MVNLIITADNSNMLAVSLLLILSLVGVQGNAELEQRPFAAFPERVHANFHQKVSFVKPEIHRSIRMSRLDKVSATTASHQWLILVYYNGTSCYGDPIYMDITGTNFCMSFDSGGSLQYTYLDNILYQSIYSDSACTINTDNIVVINSTRLFECQVMGTSSYLAQLESSFTAPSIPGILYGGYSSESYCSSTTPFIAFWGEPGSTDDDDSDFGCMITTNSYGKHSYDYYLSKSFTTSSPTAFPTAFPTASPISTAPSKSCFAGSETVLLYTGEIIPISDVKIGDSILAADKMGNTKFSQVISLPHDTNDERATFAFITTATGRSIKMTPEHIVMVDPSCGTKTVLMKASVVEKDMCLVTVEGQEQVTAVSSVSGNGIYTVITNEEMVVVNGIIASPFAENHAISHAWYNVFRAVYRILPGVMGWPVLKQANLIFGSILDSIGM